MACIPLKNVEGILILLKLNDILSLKWLKWQSGPLCFYAMLWSCSSSWKSPLEEDANSYYVWVGKFVIILASSHLLHAQLYLKHVIFHNKYLLIFLFL